MFRDVVLIAGRIFPGSEMNFVKSHALLCLAICFSAVPLARAQDVIADSTTPDKLAISPANGSEQESAQSVWFVWAGVGFLAPSTAKPTLFLLDCGRR